MVFGYPPALLKHVNKNIYDACAVLLIFLASLFRVVLTVLGWPVANGDEAVMGLMALHIQERGEHPIFFYGQRYLGTIEAHMGAVMFTFFGASVQSIRFGSIVFYAGFLVCMYILTARIYTKPLALVVLMFLGLGTEYTYIYQLQPLGYTELPFLCTLSFLIAYSIVSMQQQRRWQFRALCYFVWGVVAGLTLWAHLITAPYILVSGLLLILCCWQELLKWAMWCALLGLILGMWPLIAYNLSVGPGHLDSLHIFLSMSQLGAANHYAPLDYLASPFFITLPILLGLHPPCYIEQLPFAPPAHASQLCYVLQQAYGIGYFILFAFAILLVSIALVSLWRMVSTHSISLQQQKQQYARHYARLMLLLGAALTLIVFARNPTAVYYGVLGIRYIICTLVSLPALLWPLWNGIMRIEGTPKLLRSALFALRMSIIFGVIALSFGAPLQIFAQIPEAQTEQLHFTQLEHTLEQMHVTRFYSEYWTCNVLIIETHEQLICGDVWSDDNNFMHGTDRYRPYREMVKATANPGFVFPTGMPQIVLVEKLLKSTKTPYRHVAVAGYEIFQPERPIAGLEL